MVIGIFAVSFLACLYFFATLLTRNKKIDTLYVLFGMLVCFNSFGMLMVAAAKTLETAVFFTKVLYIGGIFSPLAMIFVLVQLCELKMPKPLRIGLVAAGLVNLGLVFSIGYSGLYYAEVKLGHKNGISYLIKEYGPTHHLYTIIMVTYMAILVYYIIYAIRKRKNESFKTILSISGAGFAVVFTYVFEKIIDLEHASIAVGCLLAALFMQHLFEHINMYDMTSNIASSVEKMKEYGYIELDDKFRYISANSYIKDVFPEILSDWVVDRAIPVSESFLYQEIISWVRENKENANKTIHVGERYLDVSVADIIYRNRRKVGFLIEFVDRTEEHRYTETIEAYNVELQKDAERASSADRAKSTFLAQMSHEIRTPINAVLGMNEMILRESKEEAVLEYASNAYNSGKALLSIINDVLDISKIEAGKMEITETEYDLYSLINDCYHMTADRAAKKGLAFLYSVDETLPCRLMGDMFHIRQIVVNFITNAVKYTDEGSVELVFGGSRKEDVFHLQVSVKDTGIGLTEENIGRLFTSFQRFDLDRNRGVEGTGLGLSICKQLAELMGGSVEAESEYGKGSVFRCIIPQKVVSAAQIGKVHLTHSAQQRYIDSSRRFTARAAHILVVDDVEMNLIVFESLLKEHKLRIDRALSGAQCLELVAKQTYDIIFMDHMMPEMDGMETYAHMQEMEHQNKNTPVIMLTANAISGEKEKYLSAGFASYLAKPIQSDKLEEMLLAYLPKEKVVWEEQPKEKEETAAEDAAGADDPAEKQDAEWIDERLGKSYTGEAAYPEILSNYLKNGKEKLEEIRRLCAEEAWKDYVTKVHALKSTSLTIGAKRLSEAAAELEQAGKAEDYEAVRQNNEELLQLYQKVLEVGAERIKAAKTETDEEKTPDQIQEIEAEALSVYAERMKAAADGFESDAVISLCKELSAYCFHGMSLEEQLREVKEAAEDFECDLAGEKAERIFDALFRIS